MFSKLSLFATAAFALLAIAAPAPGGGDNAQCQTGPQQCCNSVQKAETPQASGLLASIGVIVGAAVPIGITCTPINVLGISGTSCNQQPVCCSNNSFKGIIAIGCTPINVVV